ncbi:BON domain-containing protein [Litorimonas sp.]|uniref:BON domain-containing protein n=1 Tax=Litorimonas sp. TaxID=1892381 RepID=UPI003A8B67C7
MSKNDERSFAGALNDVNAGRAIKARMTRAYDYNLKNVDIEVAEGVALLSGNVPGKEDRIEAARIAWSAPHVQQVGNEILLGEKRGFIRGAKDGVLEKAVRTRLLANGAIKSQNFNVETHQGIVYLLGVARTPEELEQAAQTAAQTRGAREVISYARLSDDYAGMAAQLGPDPVPQGYPPAQTPMQRELPEFLKTEPLAPEQDSAPIRNAPYDEPIRLHRNQADDSSVTEEPYYIDPNTGKQIPVSNIIRKHKN